MDGHAFQGAVFQPQEKCLPIYIYELIAAMTRGEGARQVVPSYICSPASRAPIPNTPQDGQVEGLRPAIVPSGSLELILAIPSKQVYNG